MTAFLLSFSIFFFFSLAFCSTKIAIMRMERELGIPVFFYIPLKMTKELFIFVIFQMSYTFPPPPKKKKRGDLKKKKRKESIQ